MRELSTAATILLAIVAITFHEAAHGYAANALGDDTAKRMGRLSLNPLRHVDRVGTVIIPGALILLQLVAMGRIVVLFGWAKPVPIASWRFPNQRRGMMLVALAGPAMNLALAFAAAISLHVTDQIPGFTGALMEQALDQFIIVNLALALFNLIPVPPLDGGRVAVGLLPAGWAVHYARIERAGLVLVFLAIVLAPRGLAAAGIDFDPVGDVLLALLNWADHGLRVLAGAHD